MRRTTERSRLGMPPKDLSTWRFWGPYLANRAWGTVREDYSASGDAWNHFPFDHAHQKAFRWGEDGIAGFCDRYQILCWSLALWNENDPILKERFFGLDHYQGNHGEDVKECFFFLDGTPSHSYQRMLYKYPHQAFPYGELIERNRAAGVAPEVELIDTGIFDGNRYFDVEIEIAKRDWDDIVFRVTAHNRGAESAPLHLIPQLWFRNVWSWGPETRERPVIDRESNRSVIADDTMAPPIPGLLADSRLGRYRLEIAEDPQLLFCDNETNARALYGPSAQQFSEFPKDSIGRYLVNGNHALTRSDRGTKAAFDVRMDLPAHGSASIHLRLAPAGKVFKGDLPLLVDTTVAEARAEADEFYSSVHPPKASSEERNVQRQAFAGLLWTKQNYLLDVDVWLEGDHPSWPPPEERKSSRNRHWQHLNSMRVLSMPDSWEYPWFAAWDLAFQAVTFAVIDPAFAKEQLWLMLFEQFQHPNGQIPAYEWEFSDLNPPVHAWAVWRVYNMDRVRSGKEDRAFLETCFHKLMLNFTWWVNKVDREGNNVFEGGFLGLDNIAVFDRSEHFPGDAILEQSDATGWMGMFSLVMMRISLELARENKVYESLATKFFEHYAYIAAAMKMDRRGATLWDEADGFFYDILRFPDGAAVPFRVRSLVGLIPLYAVERLEESWIEPFPVFRENLNWFLKHRTDVVQRSVTTIDSPTGRTHVLSVVNQDQLRRLLARVVDPSEFLSPHGLRSMSRVHESHPFVFGDSRVAYEPAEADSRIKGGNSNWRGPVWFPTSFLMIESLRKLEKGFGGSVEIEIEQGERVSLSGVGRALAERMINLFLPDSDGYRPIYGPWGSRKSELFAKDPYWKDLVLFHEYFHGDHGEGLGAEHQTGWTALVANIIDEWRRDE